MCSTVPQFSLTKSEDILRNHSYIELEECHYKADWIQHWSCFKTSSLPLTAWLKFQKSGDIQNLSVSVIFEGFRTPILSSWKTL